MNDFEFFGVPSLKKGSGIHIKKENRGKFTDYCGGKVTQECIDKAKKSKNPKLRKRAIFAQNSRTWKHQNGGLIQKFQNSGKFIKDIESIQQGCKAGTQQCAQFQNQKFRDYGYDIKGNAWNLVGDKIIFNGYDELNIPETYDKKIIEKINKDASKNVYNNFDSKTLNPEQPYIVNMYYKGSPYQETAYNDGDKVYGTHTGILTYDNNTGRWIVTHNIHDNIHKDDFIQLQGGKGKYGVTAISTPRKSNLLNKALYVLGFQEGGNIKKYQEPSIITLQNTKNKLIAKNAKGNILKTVVVDGKTEGGTPVDKQDVKEFTNPNKLRNKITTNYHSPWINPQFVNNIPAPGFVTFPRKKIIDSNYKNA